MEYKAWAVIQDDGRGWDNTIGSVRNPHTFLSVDEANSYITRRGRTQMKPRLNVVPVKVIVDL